MYRQDLDSIASMKPDERELMRAVIEGGRTSMHVTQKRRHYIMSKWLRKKWFAGIVQYPTLTDRGKEIYSCIKSSTSPSSSHQQ